MLKTSNSTLKRKQFFTPREANSGNVLLNSRICLKYFHQCTHPRSKPGYNSPPVGIQDSFGLHFETISICNFRMLVALFTRWFSFKEQNVASTGFGIVGFVTF